MEQALKDAGKTVTYVELENAFHNDWPLEYEIYFLEKINEFSRQSMRE